MLDQIGTEGAVVLMETTLEMCPCWQPWVVGELPVLQSHTLWGFCCWPCLPKPKYLFLGKGKGLWAHVPFDAPGICQGMKWPKRQNQNLNRQKEGGSQGRDEWESANQRKYKLYWKYIELERWHGSYWDIGMGNDRDMKSSKAFVEGWRTRTFILCSASLWSEMLEQHRDFSIDYKFLWKRCPSILFFHSSLVFP